jgi:hypothetical protein
MSQIALTPAASMPEPLQTIFLWITIVGAAAVVIWSLALAMRHKSAVPPLMVLGGFFAVLLEPVVTFLGRAIHPVAGQILLFETVDRAIPWHIGLGYMAGFGAFYLTIYNRFMARTLSHGFVWKCAVISALGYFVGEAYFVSHGLWIYYDYQPLRIWSGTAPLTWNWLNTCCTMTAVTLMLFALPHLKGVAKILLIPLAISGAFMGHMGAGFPMYNAMNSNLPIWAIELSGVASVAMAMLLIWLSSLVLLGLQERQLLQTSVGVAPRYPLGTGFEPVTVKG